MTKPIVYEINVSTGEEILREMTDEEYATALAAKTEVSND